MPTPFVIRVLAVLGAGIAVSATAADHRPDPRAAIAQRLDVTVEAVTPSALPGIYEVARGGEVLYVSADGRYALAGDLYDTSNGANLTTRRRTAARHAALATVSDDDAIVFGPKNPRYSVTVFTDVDCAFCRRLHSEIAEYNRRGVRVRYLFYPREGPGSDSWKKAEAVWCAPDRHVALTLAKSGGEVPRRNCGATPVKRTYELGQELGIRGTPGIFSEEGVYLPGYQSPAQLVEKLQQLAAGSLAADGG